MASLRRTASDELKSERVKRHKSDDKDAKEPKRNSRSRCWAFTLHNWNCQLFKSDLEAPNDRWYEINAVVAEVAKNVYGGDRSKAMAELQNPEQNLCKLVTHHLDYTLMSVLDTAGAKSARWQLEECPDTLRLHVQGTPQEASEGFYPVPQSL